MFVPNIDGKLQCSLSTVIIVFCPAFVIFMLLSYMKPFDEAINTFQYQSTERIHKLCRPWFIWQDTYRKCLLNFLKNRNSMNHLHKAIENCLGLSTFEMMNVKLLRNRDDVKLVILPYWNNTPCTGLTLGVGNDIKAERKLLQLIPHCELYGADPILKSGQIFEKVGKYFEVAVSGHNGIFNSSVLINGRYRTKEVPNMEFIEFILQNITHKTFDYFLLDNEGPEYEILPLFYRGGIVEMNEIVFCQISVELHRPLNRYNMNQTKYDALTNDLIKLSPFIPVWQATPRGHIRMFLLNAQNEYCVEKFLQPWCKTEN